MSSRMGAALLGLVLSLIMVAAPANADPIVIRFGYPGVGADNRLFAQRDIVAVAHAGGFIDDEFRGDPDIKIEWTFFRGAGPALNESLAAGHLDLAVGLGDLPAIVGRANRLRTRYLVTDKVRDTIYLAVPLTPASSASRTSPGTGSRSSRAPTCSWPRTAFCPRTA
jgi:sulfonate transport system substrate-binding protein